MKSIYVPTRGPEDWRDLLAEPGKQWRDGYSAKTLAECWESADGLPQEVAALFKEAPQLLLAIPEYKVALPGGRRESQNDLFVLLRTKAHTIAATIEGKVNESFGPTLGEWRRDASPGKTERLRAICALLGLNESPADHIRYQLLHRTASAVIEADRFKTDQAAMIVHHFALSEDATAFADYVAFAGLLGLQVVKGQMAYHPLPSGRQLMLGWANGEARFLKPRIPDR